MVCLRGRLVWEFYDGQNHTCSEAVELSPNGPVVALNIPAGQWHTVRALESGSVILEMKEGAYEPQRPEDILQEAGCFSITRASAPADVGELPAHKRVGESDAG